MELLETQTHNSFQYHIIYQPWCYGIAPWGINSYKANTIFISLYEHIFLKSLSKGQKWTIKIHSKKEQKFKKILFYNHLLLYNYEMNSAQKPMNIRYRYSTWKRPFFMTNWPFIWCSLISKLNSFSKHLMNVEKEQSLYSLATNKVFFLQLLCTS